MQGSSLVLWLQNSKDTGALAFAIGTGHLVMPSACQAKTTLPGASQHACGICHK
jgi:hypothetical protein